MRRNRQASTNSAYGQFYAAGASGASGAPDAAFGGTPGRKLQRDRASAPTVAVKVDTAPRVGAFTGVVGRGSSQRALAVDSSLGSTLPARAGRGTGTPRRAPPGRPRAIIVRAKRLGLGRHRKRRRDPRRSHHLPFRRHLRRRAARAPRMGRFVHA